MTINNRYNKIIIIVITYRSVLMKYKLKELFIYNISFYNFIFNFFLKDNSSFL